MSTLSYTTHLLTILYLLLNLTYNINAAEDETQETSTTEDREDTEDTEDTYDTEETSTVPSNAIFCGGFAGFECPRPWMTCVPNPDSTDCVAECGGADCGGICAFGQYGQCGGFAGLTCPTFEYDTRVGEYITYTCVDDEFDECNVNCGGADCIGNCWNIATPITCGGILGTECPFSWLTCVDDPSDDCDPDCGGADCSGICVYKLRRSQCGGFAGTECRLPYFECFDSKGDECSSQCGGADCGGFCAKVVYA